MELRREEDNPEEQSEKRNPLCFARHAFAKTELRLKWLQGQAGLGHRWLLRNPRARGSVKAGTVKCRLAASRSRLQSMRTQGSIFAAPTARRALALLACAVLLYFAVGGTLLHQHKERPGAVCHICQSLHMPALAATQHHVAQTPQLVTWNAAIALDAATTDSFGLHRASRAPPAA